MWSRPRGITEVLAAIRTRSLWNTFRGCVVPGLRDATNHWIVRDRSGVSHACIWAESKIVPRKTARYLGNSWLLCGLMINPRRSKWLSNSSLWAASSRSDLARTSQSSRYGFKIWIPICLRGERAASMHFVKVRGARDSILYIDRPLPRMWWRPGALLQPRLRFQCRLCRLSGGILLTARALGEEVMQRLRHLLSLRKPFCKPVHSGETSESRKAIFWASLISVRFNQRWRSSTTKLAIVLPIACGIAFIVRRARSVAVRSSLKASWCTWPDSSIPWRSLAWNTWRTAIVCCADPAWPAAA